MATVLGVGDNAGSDTLTVTLTASQPANSTVHVVHAAALQNLAFFDNPSVSSLPSDSQAGSWQDATFAGTTPPKPPILGAISDHNAGTSGNRAGIQLGQTAERVSGASLSSGDTVTVNWTDNGEGAAHMLIIAIVIAFDTDYSSAAVGQYLGNTNPGSFVGVYYANGLGNEGMPVFDGHSLNWTSSGTSLPFPHDAAVMLTGAATYPATGGYTPVNGSTVAEHSSADGKLTLAVTLANAPALASIEPGGSFAGAAVGTMVCNYQFATGTVTPTSKCKKCGGMLGGVSVSSSFSKWL